MRGEVDQAQAPATGTAVAAHDTAPTDEGPRARVRQVGPFVVAVIVSLALAAIPPAPAEDLAVLALSSLGFALCGVLIVAVRWERLPMWPRFGLVLLFSLSVALLREATGGSGSGFGFLLLLAVVWQAVYGTRVEMAGAVAIVSATVTLPILVIGGDAYPTSSWRAGVLLGVVAAVVGSVVQRLVRQVRRERLLVSTVASLAKAVSAGNDPRHHICEAARNLTGADLVILFEWSGDRVRVARAAGAPVPEVEMPPDLVSDELRRAIATGEVQVVLDTARDADEGDDPIGMRCWVHQPAARSEATGVVLTLGWELPRHRVPTRAREALPLLAAEASVAIDRADLVARLAELARQDPLTGLMNRRAWDDHLDREVARTARTGRPLSVAVLDLDHFKAFNDDYGHLVGDQLLKTAAGAWTGELRGSDVLARWGGEEFAVLMPDTPAEEAERILGRLAARTPMGQTLSAGFVTTDVGVGGEVLMAGADVAVYEAKAAGRNRICRGTVAVATVAGRPVRSTTIDVRAAEAPGA